MVALTQGRNTPERTLAQLAGLLGASQTIHQGALIMRNAAGQLVRGATATGCYGVGRAEDAAVSVAADVTPLRFSRGCFRYENSAAGDAIAQADIGTVCYIVDDQTVAKTHATNTRSPAGIVEAVDAIGVWVRFDEALTRAALS